MRAGALVLYACLPWKPRPVKRKSAHLRWIRSFLGFPKWPKLNSLGQQRSPMASIWDGEGAVGADGRTCAPARWCGHVRPARRHRRLPSGCSLAAPGSLRKAQVLLLIAAGSVVVTVETGTAGEVRRPQTVLCGAGAWTNTASEEAAKGNPRDANSSSSELSSVNQKKRSRFPFKGRDPYS